MRIVCLGDSITYGQNVCADEAWPAVLAMLTGHDVRNAGVCGDTSRQGLERLRRDALMHDPDVVVIQFGHNDANTWETDNGLPRVVRSSYVENIHEFRARVIASGAHPLVLAPHAAPGRNPGNPVYRRRVHDYAAALKPQFALRSPGVSLLDDGYGVHPDPAMHARYANVVDDALRIHGQY